jgi:hypothetical protein
LNRAGDEMAATTLATLLRRMYEASTCEIDNLISELRGLWDKPETDCDSLESDIAEHAKQSAIISDSLKKLPRAPCINQ